MRCDACTFGYFFDSSNICQKCLFAFDNCEICSLGSDFKAFCQVCVPGFNSNAGLCKKIISLGGNNLSFTTILVLIASLLLALI